MKMNPKTPYKNIVNQLINNHVFTLKYKNYFLEFFKIKSLSLSLILSKRLSLFNEKKSSYHILKNPNIKLTLHKVFI